jgi:hypothetical protein
MRPAKRIFPEDFAVRRASIFTPATLQTLSDTVKTATIAGTDICLHPCRKRLAIIEAMQPNKSASAAADDSQAQKNRA